MRTSIRPDELARLGRLTEEDYVCELGVGHVLLAGALPIALELPAPARSLKPGRSHGTSHWTQDLERYFAGEPVTFSLDVEAYGAVHGFTDFELAVYGALAEVPYGQAVSYRDLALAAGRPNAYCAVGSAMARNALPVILPCHRVIKNDGRLGHYGDDPAWKERLLALEGVRVVEGRVA
jgi:methylated-DNA-[protein]-cysteine S-methyltransferase